jgi:methyl-accepting chemotaxis protein
MIKKIQEDTIGAVDSMKQGTIEVEKGKALADKAGIALGEIIKGADELGDIVAQVASASQQQSAAAEQISKNIESINSVAHQNAEGIQQIARASEDLNSLTGDLQNLVEHFKITERGEHRSYEFGNNINHAKSSYKRIGTHKPAIDLGRY